MKFGIMVAAIVAGIPLLAPGREKPARSFHLYYGNARDDLAKLAARFEPGAIVVVDTRVLEPETLKGLQASARSSGARLLGYLSIGEVHADEVGELKRFLAAESNPVTLESITIDRNETFNSYRVDVLSKPLQAWIRGKAGAILERGVDGLFLDTVDTVDTYINRSEWEFQQRARSVEAMISLIRLLKRDHPVAYVVQNGGLNLIGDTIFVEQGKLIPGQILAKPHPFNPDGLLWENAFAGTDAWSKGRLDELCRIKNAGHVDVFALGYRKSLADPPNAFFAKCRKNGFVGAWARSSEVLHEAVTVSEKDQPGATK